MATECESMDQFVELAVDSKLYVAGTLGVETRLSDATPVLSYNFYGQLRATSLPLELGNDGDPVAALRCSYRNHFLILSPNEDVTGDSDYERIRGLSFRDLGDALINSPFAASRITLYNRAPRTARELVEAHFSYSLVEPMSITQF